MCSGALFYAANTKKILFLQKSRGKHQGTWGLVGGTNAGAETPWEGLQREIKEEIGIVPDIVKTIPLESFVSDDAVFNYHTYLCILAEEFIPLLSSEHIGYAWATIEHAPKPLHQGLKNSLGNKIIKTKIQNIFNIVNML